MSTPRVRSRVRVRVTVRVRARAGVRVRVRVRVAVRSADSDLFAPLRNGTQVSVRVTAGFLLVSPRRAHVRAVGQRHVQVCVGWRISPIDDRCDVGFAPDRAATLGTDAGRRIPLVADRISTA